VSGLAASCISVVLLSGCVGGGDPSGKEMCQELAEPACERLERCGYLYGLPIPECEARFVPVCERFIELADAVPSTDDAMTCGEILSTIECGELHPSCSGFGADRRLPLALGE
jgi:hypothetical protein